MTTELEQEILRVLEASQYGLSVYAKPGADNISRAEIMDSMPTAIGPAGELAAEEVTRTMDLSREEQEAEMRAFVPALKGAATGAAVATATTIPDIIGLGYGGVKALLAKEGEKGQAFLDGLSSISGAVGSEKAGQIYAEYVGGLDATDEEKAAMMTGYQAGEFGGIPGLAGAYQLVKKGVKAAPNFIESAGEAAKARMAGGTTLSSGVNPDAAIAAAGDAIAKFRAPTEKKPGIIAFHGSGADFDEFKLEKIGTGEGAQAYGYGLYFTDSEDIARFYRDTISRRQDGIPQSVPDNPENVAENLALDINFNEGVFGDTKQLQINSASPDYDFYIQTLDDNAVETTQSGALKTFEFRDGSIISLLDETVPVFNGKALDSVYTSDVQDVFGAEIADIAQRAKDMGVPGTLEELTDDVTTVLSQLGQGLGSKRDMSVAVESLAPSGQGAPSRFKTIYNHFIEPKSTIETTSTVTELGAKKGKMYKVGLEPKPEDMLDYQGTFADQPKNVQDALKAIGYQVETDATGMKNAPAQVELAMKRPMPMILDSLKGRITEEIRTGKQAPGQADKILSEKLLEQGVPGIKYRAAGSRAASVDAADAEMNYVIFDDKMIKILEKYGIVGPVAITGVAASQQEGESDGQSS
jgi:hypothetical protein